MKRALVLSCLLALAAACGGAQTQPTSAAEPAAQATTQVADAWSEELTEPQKVDFMKAKVAPHIASVFKGYDAARYADFGCKTCHGPNNQDPKDFLPRLTVKDGQLDVPADKAEIAKFMGEKVTPEMVSAMGVAPFDPATHQGFGCNGCHAIETK